MSVDQDTWIEWLEHPATKALREWASAEKQNLMEMWAAGNFSAAFDIEMAVKNAGATGACSIYTLIKEMDFSVIVESEDHGEQFGPGAQRESSSDSGV
jgi:hypothetical protein